MSAPTNPHYDDMPDRLLRRFPEISPEQAADVRDFIKTVSPNYFESRDEHRADKRYRERPQMDGGRRAKYERP